MFVTALAGIGRVFGRVLTHVLNVHLVNGVYRVADGEHVFGFDLAHQGPGIMGHGCGPGRSPGASGKRVSGFARICDFFLAALDRTR